MSSPSTYQVPQQMGNRLHKVGGRSSFLGAVCSAEGPNYELCVDLRQPTKLIKPLSLPSYSSKLSLGIKQILSLRPLVLVLASVSFQLFHQVYYKSKLIKKEVKITYSSRTVYILEIYIFQKEYIIQTNTFLV